MVAERREEMLTLGRRLQQAREAAGYSQQEVADLLRLSRSTIADIEAGRRRVDSLLLRDLAALYGIRPWELLEPAPKQSQKARLRDALFAELESAKASPQDKQQIARFWQMLDYFSSLSHEMGRMRLSLLQDGRRFNTRVPDFIIEAEADRAREFFGLGPFPVSWDMRYLIESRGIPVFMWPLDPDPISGLFLNHPELGPVLLVNASQVKWRQVFTLAHEFAHVWLHRQEHVVVGRIFAPQGDPRVIERQANTFAAEFLMPEEGVKKAIAALGVEGQLTIEDIVRLQRYFRVSYKAMLVRLKNLRLITQEHFEKLSLESPVRVALQLGYEVDASEVGGTQELPFYKRLPIEYRALVLRAWEEEKIGEGKAAQLLGTDRHCLNEFMRSREEAMRKQQEEIVPAEVGG